MANDASESRFEEIVSLYKDWKDRCYQSIYIAVYLSLIGSYFLLLLTCFVVNKKGRILSTSQTNIAVISFHSVWLAFWRSINLYSHVAGTIQVTTSFGLINWEKSKVAQYKKSIQLSKENFKFIMPIGNSAASWLSNQSREALCFVSSNVKFSTASKITWVKHQYCSLNSLFISPKWIRLAWRQKIRHDLFSLPCLYRPKLVTFSCHSTKPSNFRRCCLKRQRGWQRFRK